MPTASRAYRGVPAEQRRADRRERLVAAGIEEVGSAGWHGLTVRAVCSRAKLTERYFYESFGDREALLLAVFDAVAAEVAADRDDGGGVGAARRVEERARAAIGAFVDLIADEPNRARVMLVEGAGSDALDVRRREAIGTFARLVRDAAAEFYGVSGRSALTDIELTAHALVGVGRAAAHRVALG